MYMQEVSHGKYAAFYINYRVKKGTERELLNKCIIYDTENKR